MNNSISGIEHGSAHNADDLEPNSDSRTYEPPSFQNMGSFRGETGGGGALYHDPNYRGLV